MHSNKSHDDLRIIGGGQGKSDGEEKGEVVKGDPLKDGVGEADSAGDIGDEIADRDGDEVEKEVARGGRSRGEKVTTLAFRQGVP